MRVPEIQIDKLFRPKSIAVVGASTRALSFTYRCIQNLGTVGFPGPVYPVNPRYDEVCGLRCYPSLGDLPGPVDAVYMGTAAARAPALLEECGRLGIGAVVLPASGFSDADAEGAALEREAAEIAARHGIALNGPNNLGVVNRFERAALWPSSLLDGTEAGPVALISESGSIAIATSQDERGLGLGYTITSGNEAVLTAGDYLGYLAGDARIKVVLLFLETVRKPETFAAAALKAHAAGQRLVVLKVGVSESGIRAVQAHTGGIAGEDAVYDAFFRRLGILRVHDYDEMLELAALLSAYPEPPPTPHTVPITLSGGQAALLADLAERYGISTPELRPETLEGMAEAFPDFSNPRNPLDAFGLGWDEDRFAQIIAALVADPALATIALAMDAPSKGGADATWVTIMADICARHLPSPGKRFVFINNAAACGLNPHVRERLDAAGIPYLQGMRAGFAALGLWSRPAAPEVVPAPADEADAEAWRARAGTPGGLSEPARMALLADAGVSMVPCRVVAGAMEAVAAAEEFGWPVALKAATPGLLHKTERGLIRLGLTNDEAVREAYEDLAALIAGEAGGEVFVEPMVGAGVELILGARMDPGFGAVIAVGPGGTLVEVVGRASVRLGPVSAEVAGEMLSETPAAKLLVGVRGAGPFDTEAAAHAIAAFSRFAHAMRGVLAAVEVNPLIVLPRGQGAVGVDAVLEPFG